MSQIAKISEGWKKLMSAFGPAAFHDATVLSVDDDHYLCDVMFEGEVQMNDIRLRAIVSDKSSIDVLPVVGSQVVIGKLDDDDYIVIACDQISSYRVTTGKAVFEMTAGGHVISNGNENLKEILSNLTDQILQIYAPKHVVGLTAIKTRLNSLFK